MPITHQVSLNSELSYCIWEIAETEEQLLSFLHLDHVELADLNRKKVPEKRLEWLAARNALKHLINPYGQFFLMKDEFGKPHFTESDWHVTMSHAKGYGAAAIQRSKPIGIDIEFERPQIIRIAKKFLHDKEKSWADQDIPTLTKIWGAKEALYKLHGRTQLIFAEQLLIHPFQDKSGVIFENDSAETYHLLFDKFESLYISMAY